MLEREQDERDMLEALNEYKSYSGMSVEEMPAIVKTTTLKGRFIAHTFNTWWTAGVVKSAEKKKSVTGQFAVKYKPT